MNSLRAIVYVSTATIEFDDAALEGLLADAREFNREAGVTGVLLFGEGRFMQYFEGAEPGITDAWDRIQASKRHRGIVQLFDHPVEQRLFSDWQMGFVRTTTSKILELSNTEWTKMRTTAGARFPSSAGLDMLKLFSKMSEQPQD